VPKCRALKEEMIKDKQGFPKVPKEQKSMDDLGYMTRIKSRRVKGK
jgi:hypothetical protein